MNDTQKQVVVSGAFDDLKASHLRFLEEAAQLGELTVLLWADELVGRIAGKPPKFPEAERRYLLESVRYVSRVKRVANRLDKDALPDWETLGFKPDLWVMDEAQAGSAQKAFAEEHGVQYQALRRVDLTGFPERPAPAGNSETGRRKVMVTGCYDWFHSGHVRFFEEVSAYGDLYVVVGHDANIRLLKGEGHPQFSQDERRYVVQSIRFVTQALVSTGDGWLDAEPEIQRLQPDIYAVNEDGDRPEKREYCAQHGLHYLVLKRIPAPGLPPRTSTDLRGF